MAHNRYFIALLLAPNACRRLRNKIIDHSVLFVPLHPRRTLTALRLSFDSGFLFPNRELRHRLILNINLLFSDVFRCFRLILMLILTLLGFPFPFRGFFLLLLVLLVLFYFFHEFLVDSGLHLDLVLFVAFFFELSADFCELCFLNLLEIVHVGSEIVLLLPLFSRPWGKSPIQAQSPRNLLRQLLRLHLHFPFFFLFFRKNRCPETHRDVLWLRIA